MAPDNQAGFLIGHIHKVANAAGLGFVAIAKNAKHIVEVILMLVRKAPEAVAIALTGIEIAVVFGANGMVVPVKPGVFLGRAPKKQKNKKEGHKNPACCRN